mmetsp:Transcript_27299/g.72862  ORF Transcript_27299/g.72862 Transcript_27299/m.72862 type:complete len:281 (-) Transcript_27299:512-1354(-)
MWWSSQCTCGQADSSLLNSCPLPASTLRHGSWAQLPSVAASRDSARRMRGRLDRDPLRPAPLLAPSGSPELVMERSVPFGKNHGSVPPCSPECSRLEVCQGPYGEPAVTDSLKALPPPLHGTTALGSPSAGVVPPEQPPVQPRTEHSMEPREFCRRAQCSLWPGPAVQALALLAGQRDAMVWFRGSRLESPAPKCETTQMPDTGSLAGAQECAHASTTTPRKAYSPSTVGESATMHREFRFQVCRPQPMSISSAIMTNFLPMGSYTTPAPQDDVLELTAP